MVDDFGQSPARIPTRAEVAQSVEHMTENHGVASSILALGIFPSFEYGEQNITAVRTYTPFNPAPRQACLPRP